MYVYNSRLLRVVDGDTVVFSVDLGFGITSAHAVRLAGVNCPEVVGEARAAGVAAAEFTRRWFADNPGPYVLRTSKGRETEKYGRYLGTVATADGRVLNDDLVAAGHAATYIP